MIFFIKSRLHKNLKAVFAAFFNEILWYIDLSLYGIDSHKGCSNIYNSPLLLSMILNSTFLILSGNRK